jgi:hypothetical protein
MVIARMDRKRVVTIVVIVLLLALGFALWRAGEDNIPPPTTLQTMRNGEAEGRRATSASWEFTYDKAITLGDQITQEIDGIHDGTFWKNGKAVAHMRADRAVYNTMTHDFSVNGPLHVTLDDHGKTRVFDANSATWSDAQEILRIPGPATIGSGVSSKLTVTNVVVDLRTDQYTIGKIEGSATP